MKNLGTLTLESERLILRRFKLDDSKAMYKNWASDDDVTRYLMWPTHTSEAVSQNILNDWVNQYTNDNYYQWAIVPKFVPNEPIGSIAVVNSIDPRVAMAQIGYCIGKKWWHQGIVSEALKLVMDFLFDKVGVNRVEARFDTNNPHSGDVMLKCGMKFEGTHRQADRNNTGICDASYYALLACER